MLRQPLHAVRTEAKRHDYGVSRHHVLRAGDDLRAAAALRIRLAHFGARHLHAANLTVGIHFHAQRLDVKLELNAFFARVFTSRFEPGMFSSSRR